MKQEKRIVKKGKEGRALPRGGSEEKNYGNEAWIENNTELSKEKKEKVLTIEKKESIWMERKREGGGLQRQERCRKRVRELSGRKRNSDKQIGKRKISWQRIIERRKERSKNQLEIFLKIEADGGRKGKGKRTTKVGVNGKNKDEVRRRKINWREKN